MEKEGLEVCRFGHGGMYGVIRSLEALKEQSGMTASFACRTRDQVTQSVRFQMVGAGTGHEHASGAHEVEPQLVDPLIGFEPLPGILLALDEGGWVKTHDIEGTAFAAQLRQKSERVALQGFRFRAELFGVALRVGKGMS